MSIAGSVVKERPLTEIEKLPELQEVLDFVGYLLSKGQRTQAVAQERELDPAKDPLLQFIDGVSHGSLAKDIDSELYRLLPSDCLPNLPHHIQEATRERGRDQCSPLQFSSIGMDSAGFCGLFLS